MRVKVEKSSIKKPTEHPPVVITHDLVNEQVLLAAAVSSDQTRQDLTSAIPADCFQHAQHRDLWIALQELTRRKLNYDPATLQQIRAVDVAYLSELQAARPDIPVNLSFHIETLRWDAARARLVTGPLSSLVEAIRDEKADRERVRALARMVATSLDGYTQRAYLHESKSLVQEQLSEIDQRATGKHYPFGIDGLDYDLATKKRRITMGSAPGKVTVVTGVSGGGKSTFAANLVLGLTCTGRKTLYGAWEMGGGMTLELMALISLAAEEKGWSRSALIEGSPLSHERRVRLEERMHAITRYVTFMANPFRRRTRERKSNDANLDLVQGYIADSGCEIFVADLWKRCLADTSPDEEEDALIRQQSMAEETRTHCVLLQQQRLKDVEMRTDKRPTREGIKGTSAWVDVADTILGVNLPSLWKRIEENTLEVLVLKQRYGKWPLGVAFDWNGDQGLITGGTTIEYARPGEDEASNLGAPRTSKVFGRRG